MTADGRSADRMRACLGLALLVPAPSLGVASAFFWFPGPVGQALFFAAKAYLIALPVLWHVHAEGRPIRWVRPSRGAMAVGSAWGLLFGGAIVAVWLLLAENRFDPALLRRLAAENRFDTPCAYLLLALSYGLVNSLIEEYVWRWFVLRRCAVLMPGRAAAAASGLLFSVHHWVALSRWMPWDLNLLCCAGTFTGGVIWAGLYLRYGTIWPGWASHALADAAAFGLGAAILFGG
jgi:membrane protease YdiL (CAAX protease family)